MKNNKIQELEKELEVLKASERAKGKVKTGLGWKYLDEILTPEKSALYDKIEEAKKEPKRAKMINELNVENWQEVASKYAKSYQKLLNIETEKELGEDKVRFIYNKASEKKQQTRTFWKSINQTNPLTKWN
jgi:hypothetical protein